MKLSIKAGATSQSINVFIADSSSTTGAGMTGLVYNSSGLTAYYALPKAAAVQITLATLAAITTAYSSGGFKEVDATNMPGWYRLDLPDAAIASGRFVSVHLKGVTNMAPLPIEIELTAWDNQVAACDANVTKLLGTAWLTPGTAGTPDVNVKLWNALTTVALPLVPTTAGRTLDVSTTGEAGLDWANIGSPTTTVALTGTTIAVTQKVDVDTIKTNPVVNAGTITFPTTATLASTTNITAGTVATATNVTTVNGLAAGVITATSIAADAITAAKIADNAIDRATFAADTGLQTIRSNTAQAGASGSITLDASASATTNFYTGAEVYLTGGTGVGQYRRGLAYNGGTKVLTVTPAWATNPDNTSTFAMLPSGMVDAQAWMSGVISTPTNTGVPNVNAKTWNDLATVALPLIPTTAGRTLDVSTTGEAGVDWANVGSPTTTLALTGTTIATTQKVDVETIKTNPVVNAGTVTFPTTATLASTTNITAGTVATATNVTTVNGLAAGVVTAAAIADGAIDNATFAADTGLKTIRSGTAQAGAAGTITLDASASATTNFYQGDLVYLTGGTGAGQYRLIYTYNATTKVAGIHADWATNPDNTTTFAIVPRGFAAVGMWVNSPLTATATGLPDVNSAYINSVATGNVTTIEANQGTTQPVNFTGTGSSALVKSDTVDAAGVAWTSGAITAAAFATDSITAAALKADAVTEIQSGLATAAALATVAGYVDTEVAAIKAKTDLIPAAPASTTNITAAVVSLAATGLDAVTATAAAGVPSTIRDMIVWVYRRFGKKFTRDTSDNSGKAYADDNTTVLTTQTLSTSGTVQTQSAVS